MCHLCFVPLVFSTTGGHHETRWYISSHLPPVLLLASLSSVVHPRLFCSTGWLFTCCAVPCNFRLGKRWPGSSPSLPPSVQVCVCVHPWMSITRSSGTQIIAAARYIVSMLLVPLLSCSLLLCSVASGVCFIFSYCIS